MVLLRPGCGKEGCTLSRKSECRRLLDLHGMSTEVKQRVERAGASGSKGCGIQCLESQGLVESRFACRSPRACQIFKKMISPSAGA